MVLLVVAGVLTPAEGAETAGAVAFDLPAGEFSETIQEFKRQADVSVWYSSPKGPANGIMTHVVHGVFGKSEALARMLEGTGCSWRWESADSVVVRVDPDSAAGEMSPGADPEEVNRSARPVETAAPDTGREEVLVTGTYVDVELAEPRIRPDRALSNRAAAPRIIVDALTMNWLGRARDEFGKTVAGNLDRGQSP